MLIALAKCRKRHNTMASGAARRAGIRPGDVILAVNDTAVATAEQLQSAISDMNRKAALLIQRGNVRMFIAVDAG
ncbi:MAG TPA: PDZ domain-containing protein [Steroidobacteraceae bacterium]|nr:PDZ domain-containing protein [Steroidobacteraceae bacterium]